MNLGIALRSENRRTGENELRSELEAGDVVTVTVYQIINWERMLEGSDGSRNNKTKKNLKADKQVAFGAAITSMCKCARCWCIRSQAVLGKTNRP